MGLPASFDLDLLRSFVAIAEEKSFTRAASRVGRTQAAVSLQMQRLEGLLGKVVIVRGKGGTVDLNGDGLQLLERARELLALNDDIMRSMQAAPVHGTIRLGIAAELSSRFLPQILDRFAHTMPGVEVEVEAAVSCLLALKLKNAEFDLVIVREGLEPRQWPVTEVWRSQAKWITSLQHAQHMREPLPLAISAADCPGRPADVSECPWRSMLLRALEQDGRSYRIVSTSSTTQALLAPVQAGLAVTSTPGDYALPQGLRTVRADEGLPKLPESRYFMLKGRNPRQPITDVLAVQVQDVFSESHAP
jgi:DNA-binding transcriptional LysR family regulator